jgi:hypothetical protein
MIGAALALIVIGLVSLLLLPWFVGVVVVAVGVVLLVLFLLGFGRRAAEGRP